MSLLNILIITANQTLAYEYHQRLLGTAYKVSSGWVFPLSKAKTYESLEIYFVGGIVLLRGVILLESHGIFKENLKLHNSSIKSIFRITNLVLKLEQLT